MGQDWVVGFPISHSSGHTKHEIIFISITSAQGGGDGGHYFYVWSHGIV